MVAVCQGTFEWISSHSLREMLLNFILWGYIWGFLSSAIPPPPKKKKKNTQQIQLAAAAVITVLLYMLCALSHYRLYVPRLEVLLGGRTATQVGLFRSSCSHDRRCNLRIWAFDETSLSFNYRPRFVCDLMSQW